MKICLSVYGNLVTDYRVFKIARTLYENNNSLVIVTNYHPTYERNDFKKTWGFAHIKSFRLLFERFGGKIVFPIFMLKTFLNALNTRCALYIACDIPPLLPLFLVAKIKNSKLIYDSHEFITETPALINRKLVKLFWEKLEGHIIHKTDLTITVSNNIGKALKEKYEIEHPLIIRNLPLQIKSFEKKDVIRELLGLSEQHKILLYQGSLNPGVGIITMLSIIKKMSMLVFVIIGDGPEKKSILNVINENELDKRVYLLSPVPFTELYKYTLSADIGLITFNNTNLSNYLTIPNKLFEYIQAGIPVVASDFPGLREIVETYKVGELVNPDDSEEIVSSLQKLLASPGLLDKYMHNSRRAALELHWGNEEKKLMSSVNRIMETSLH